MLLPNLFKLPLPEMALLTPRLSERLNTRLALLVTAPVPKLPALPPAPMRKVPALTVVAP